MSSGPDVQTARGPVHSDSSSLPIRLRLLLAISAGSAAANIYYNQPLLRLMADAFHVTERQIGAIPMLLQTAFAAGVLFVVPLGDTLDRRKLIVTLFAATSLALLATAAAPGFYWLLAASALLGLTTLSAHLIMPFAMHLAPKGQSGSVAGTIAAGVLTGILASRTLAGIIGDWFGWRTVYVLAAILMLVLGATLWKVLPHTPPGPHLPYHSLLKSLWDVGRHRTVFECAGAQGLLFGTFNLFWTTLVFLLASPAYNYGADVAGSFGLLGLVAIIAAPLIGGAIDRLPYRVIAAATVAVSIVGWLVLRFWGFHLWGLGVGVILLDIGIHNSFVNNQQRVFRVNPEARSRLNSVFMMFVFLGAALGTSIGAWAWTHGGWIAVCDSGLALSFAALGFLARPLLRPHA